MVFCWANGGTPSLIFCLAEGFGNGNHRIGAGTGIFYAVHTLSLPNSKRFRNDLILDYMSKIQVNVRAFTWDDEPLSPLVFLMKRSADRRNRIREIIVEVLKNVTPAKPTRDELQKLCKVRRTRFIPMLKSLLERGSVERTGSGTKTDPFRYRLP